MSKFLKSLLAAFAVLAMAHVAAAGSVTVGTNNDGNCYPFMCNDSGTNVGQSIDYQQAYRSTAFSQPITISSIYWYYTSEFGGNPTLLGGSYTFEWGYTSSLNLSNNLPSNYIGAPFLIGTATVPTGGVNFGTTLTLSGFAPFTYHPADGDLLLEIIVSNQDNVPNGSGNGYNQSDDTGTVTSRAYCITGDGCFADGTDGLVTTFNGTTATTPEPSSLLLFGTSLLGLAPFRRKLFGR